MAHMSKTNYSALGLVVKTLTINKLKINSVYTHEKNYSFAVIPFCYFNVVC